MVKKNFFEKRKIWNQNGQNHKAGETLVEVMVSVVIFLLLVAMLEGSVAFCSNAQRKSAEISDNTSAAIKAYWDAYDADKVSADSSTGLKARTKTAETSKISFTEEGGDGSSAFDVSVNLQESTLGYQDTDGEDQTVTFYTYGRN